jgi:hypothetical protein
MEAGIRAGPKFGQRRDPEDLYELTDSTAGAFFGPWRRMVRTEGARP